LTLSDLTGTSDLAEDLGDFSSDVFLFAGLLPAALSVLTDLLRFAGA
jgi:hypothetical protein